MATKGNQLIIPASPTLRSRDKEKDFHFMFILLGRKCFTLFSNKAAFTCFHCLSISIGSAFAAGIISLTHGGPKAATRFSSRGIVGKVQQFEQIPSSCISEGYL